ncbi:MAG: hypothetical protein A3G25_04660 [Betaproteobacteria bacterium RIFCSPLOWO2_12_FULL_63_13]|nr:MAG: hypothetical protein A3H32_10165 [Betaproteobacteria bacterium RIFCSPLOWO2_02_FULL_63_19]OGA45535.1 MAG: hypothetical protein A3G25_04660 [Betaproteobacteria bacterium RIFCSPLOWO2_12_FULL_63_13]
MLYGVSRILALTGGILACAMALLMSGSVAGRAVVGYPIPGDYEITGVINGTAIFAFLPYCQLMRANVIVDFFTGRASARAKAALDAFGSLLFLAIGVLLTWRLVVGGMDLYKNSDVTPTLSFPLWVTLPFDIACMVVLVLVTGYTLAQNVADLRFGGAGQTKAGNRAG